MFLMAMIWLSDLSAMECLDLSAGECHRTALALGEPLTFMSGFQTHRTLFQSAQAGIQRWVQTKIWGMDIHRSARIEPSALIDRTWPRGVHIGPDCHICEEAVVLTHDFTRGLYLHTVIGARCHLGPRAIVLPGLTIGDDCLIMPGALVTKDMPPNTVATGNPADIAPRS